MAISINKLTNANIYVDGNNYLGKASEVELPDIVHKMAEHNALGMVGMVEFFSGIDKLEAKIKWNSYYSDAMVKGANPFTTVQLQLRASVDQYTSSGRSAEIPVVVTITGQFKNIPLGNFKQHENVELESNINVQACKVEMGGQTLMDIDVLANIFKVNGVDILGTYKTNIGQ